MNNEHWKLSAYKDPKLTIYVDFDVKNPKKALRERAFNYGYDLPKKFSIDKVKVGGNAEWAFWTWSTTIPMKDTKRV